MRILSCAVLLAISAAFLACSTNENSGVPACKIAAKREVPDKIKELDIYKNLDPICKTEQRKLVSFRDISTSEIDWDYVYSHLPGYVPGSGRVGETGSYSQGKASYNVNGVEMNQEEYEAYKKEYDRKYNEELNKTKLIVPCVISRGLALLTDEEIAELKAKYKGLRIEETSNGFEISYKEYSDYKELDELDPSCKNEQKRFVIISDTNSLRPPENLDSLVNECTKDKSTMEEIIACKDEVTEYWDKWTAEHPKRNLPIPCVAIETAINWWGAWLTDDEVAGLVSKYGVSYEDGNHEYGPAQGGSGPVITPQPIDEKNCGE